MAPGFELPENDRGRKLIASKSLEEMSNWNEIRKTVMKYSH